MTFTASLSEITQKNENGMLGAHPSWCRVRLGKIAQILNGFAFSSINFSTREGKPLLRIRDILNGETEAYYKGEYDPVYLVEHNDLLVGMDGDFNCALWKGEEALLNQRVCKLIPNENFFNLELLAYVLPGYLKAINTKTSSVTVKHLSSKTIADIPLPLPPLPEQHRIVSKLEELFTKLDAGVEELKKVKAQLKHYRQSVLKHAFEGKMTAEWRAKHGEELEPASALLERIKEERKKKLKEKYKELPPVDTSELPELPEGWVWVSIYMIAESMKNGVYKPRQCYNDNGIACLRMYNIENGSIVWKDVKRMILPSEEIEEYKLEVGDVLVNRVNSRELVGKAAPILQGLETCVFESKNIRLRLFKQHIESKYVSFWFQIFSQKYFDQNAQQTVGMASINQKQLGAMPIPLSPFSEQQKIVEEIERRFSVADAVEKVVDQNLKQAERLRQSLLKRAFEGKLVLQDPTDEPASMLLERIKTEREDHKKEEKPKPNNKTKRKRDLVQVQKQTRFTDYV